MQRNCRVLRINSTMVPKIHSSLCQIAEKMQGALINECSLDEVFITINGKLRYLWRAVNQDGNELDVLVTNKRPKRAAIKFFKKLFKSQRQQPRKIITDKLASYKAALQVLGSKTTHITDQYKNNIAEVSHQKTRQQQRKMRQFKSIAQTQRFLVNHGAINNHFRPEFGDESLNYIAPIYTLLSLLFSG